MHKYYPENFTIGFYRPFCKNNLYFDKDFNAMLYTNKRLFPYSGVKNKIICI
jgi:predicted helicase